MKKYILIAMVALSVALFGPGCGSRDAQKNDKKTGTSKAAHDDHDHKLDDGHDHNPEHESDSTDHGHDEPDGDDHSEHDGHNHQEESEGDHEGHDRGERDDHGVKDESHTEDESELIVFSANLQRDFGIETERATRREIHDIIRSLGEIKAAGTREAEVVAPFAGMLLPDAETGIVRPGQRVSKGDHLAVIAPSTEEGGWNQLLGSYRLAKAEYDRVLRLSEEGAVAPRRVQEARTDLEAKNARLRAALGGLEISDLDSTGEVFHLRAPITGILSDIHLRFGQHVESGEHLFNIVDPTLVWLEAQVPASESQQLEEIKDAYFTISGSETIYRTRDFNGRLISVGGMLDPSTRRVPVIFEMENPNNIFRPGSYVQAYLRLNEASEALAVPHASLLDEDGTSVVMVRVAPDEFRKAIVQIGARDAGFVAVTAGLSEGDEVVTKGAYKIQLASSKTGAVDAHAGHGH